MAEYVDFHYMPLEGKITGKQVLKQTEDAINDLGQHVYEIDIDNELVQEAIDKSEQAINTAESALSAVTVGRSVWFNNVAEMVNSDTETGVVAETKGYYLVNDGGGAVYIIRQKTGGDVVDGGSVIQLDDENMVAQLVTDGEVNVKQFGAMGNGVDDDSTAFQNTSTYAQTNGFTAFVALGTYNVTETITGTFNSFGEVTIVGGGTVDIVNLHDVVDDVTAIKEEVESSTTSAQASATSAATSATNAANSATSAGTTLSQLIAYLDTKETLTAPVVDPTLTISGAAADAKVTGDTFKNATIFNISSKIDVEQGFFSISNGEPSTSSNWCRSPYVDKEAFLNTTTIKMYLVAYTYGGAYVGRWDGTTFSTTYNASAYFRAINVNDWHKKYPNYLFKVIYTGDGTLTPSDVLSEIVVTNYPDQINDKISGLTIKNGVLQQKIEWENGSLSGGNPIVSSTGIRTVSYIDLRTCGYQNFIVTSDSSALNFYISQYDSNFTFLSSVSKYGKGSATATNSNTAYVKVYTYSDTSVLPRNQHIDHISTLFIGNGEANENAFKYTSYALEANDFVDYLEVKDPQVKSTNGLSVTKWVGDFTLNGTTTADVRIRATEEFVLTTSDATINAWNTGLTLENGATYEVETELISGSVQGDFPTISVYKTGTSSSVGSLQRRFNSCSRTFVADTSKYNIVIYCATGRTFSNAVIRLKVKKIKSKAQQGMYTVCLMNESRPDVYNIPEGACIVGEETIVYCYYNLNIFVKYNLRTYERQIIHYDDVPELADFHNNDMTYNPTTDKVYVATTNSTLVELNSSTLEVENVYELKDENGDTVNFSNIAYDRINNRYYCWVNQTLSPFVFNIYDASFNYVDSISANISQSLTYRQGLETDGEYLYFTSSNPYPRIFKIAFDGSYCYYDISGASATTYEVETIINDWNKRWYLFGNVRYPGASSSGGAILHLLKFDQVLTCDDIAFLFARYDKPINEY